MERKLILCRGIQGSGKTTWAEQYCKEHSNTIRLNRDDIRSMFSQKWSEELEHIVKHTEYMGMIAALSNGMDVVVDDVSNLSKQTRELIEFYISQMHHPEVVKIVNQDFFIPLQVCIDRDSLRANPIGEKKVTMTYNMYKTIIEGKDI